MQYSLVKHDADDANLTVYAEGADPLVMHSSHPNFARAASAVVSADLMGLNGEEEQRILDLFDASKIAAERFEGLSERVSVANGRVYFDNDEVDSSLTQAIIRFLDDDEDFRPLVEFFENVQDNPNEHSRTQLYDWLNAHDFTIDDMGYIVGYKGVQQVHNGGYQSINKGTAIVNGEAVTGYIPNEVGSVVEMPRSEVEHDPTTGCSTGLHVGTYEYAGRFSRGAMLRVSVNPRDVVSVPTDASGEKVRVCRYRVEEIIDAPVTSALLHSDADEFDAEEDFEAWGEEEIDW